MTYIRREDQELHAGYRLYERCCGLDIHKASIAACVVITRDGKSEEETRRFGTMMADLLDLAAWLKARGIEHVAMESTGVYWQPVRNILEGFDLLLANAQEVKIVPGRKTDQKDSQWIADLHQHGLLRKSFVPPRQVRDLRDLTRTRARLAQEHSSICNRIQKVLEDANIKLGAVASDVFGASGHAMLLAMMKGESNAEALAELSKGRLRSKIPRTAAGVGRTRDGTPSFSDRTAVAADGISGEPDAPV